MMIDPLSTPRRSIFSLSDRRDNDLLDEVTRSPATHALEKVSWLPERELQRRRSKMFEMLRKGVDPGPFSDDCSCSDRKLYNKSTKNEVFDMSGMFAASQSVEGTSEFPHIVWTTLKEEEENYSFASRRSTSYPDTCLAPPLTPQPSRRFPRSSSTSSLTSSLGKRRRRSKVSESKRLMRSIALGANLSLLEDDSCSSLTVEPAAILLAVPAPTDEEEEKQQRDPPVVPTSRDFRSSASKTVNECLKMLGEDLTFSPTNVSSPVQSNMFWYQEP